MNVEGRLRKLEEQRKAEAASGCYCPGRNLLVVWPGQEEADSTCPVCGRERTVLRVEYVSPGEPEEQREALESLTPEQRKEAEERMLAGETVTLEAEPEDCPPPPGGLRKYKYSRFYK